MKTDVKQLQLVTLTLGVWLVLELLPSAAEQLRAQDFEERVACQQTIEQVYWRHRVWPKQNPQPKPPIEKVMPFSAIQRKVDDTLRKSAALAQHWRQRITGEQLQAEINRMARNTRKPALLRELWEALGNDPARIAECLARPALADRFLRNRYAVDERIHGALRARAQADLEHFNTTAQMPQMTGEYREVEWVKAEPGKSGDAIPGENIEETEWQVERLSSDEWDEMLGRLGRAHLDSAITDGMATSPRTELGRLSDLREDSERFYVTAVFEHSPERVRMATVEWRKQSFDEWWRNARERFGRNLQPPKFAYQLAEIAQTICTDDTWKPTKSLPERSSTAVWTGEEVIFWGSVHTGARYNPSTDTWIGVSPIGAPRRRTLHSAVWNGEEMIVWGGCDNSGHLCGLNSGGRYNPSTDMWTPTSGIGAPSIRRSHAAVWTGSVMVVWGGCTPSFDGRCPLLNTGGVYDSSTDIWTPTTTVNVPTARLGHSTVWTGTEMIIWGGGLDFSPLRTGGRYDPDADTWTPTSLVNAADERTAHSAVWTGTEMIVWGGALQSITVRTGGRYDPVTDTWTPTNRLDAPSARSGHSAVWTDSEMIVWGGGDGPSRYADGSRYDPFTDTWTPISSDGAPSARAGHTAVWTGSLMVIWGSVSNKTGGRYDPAIDTWQPTDNNDAIKARELHTAVWTGAEMIVWGGEEGASGFPATGGRYDPATDSWQPTSTSGGLTNRRAHTALWTGMEMLIWGGISGNFTFSDGGRYDPLTDTWARITAIGVPARRGYHTGVWTGIEMVVWGGNSEGILVATGGRYDPTSDTWTPTSTVGAPEARYLHSAVWTDAEMIIWGGVGLGGHLNTGARYDPASETWTLTSTEGALEPRRFHTALWSGMEMIIWGGRDGPFGGPNRYFNSGGRYDPVVDSWTPTNLDDAPSPRASHVGVWTGSLMVIWGGCGGGSYCDQNAFTGARFDPFADVWAPTSIQSAASARNNHTAVWTGEEMIIWGGYAQQASTYTTTGGRYCVAPSGP